MSYVEEGEEDVHPNGRRRSSPVNPRDPDNLVAGANDYRLFNARESRNDGAGVAYASFDGGHTWTDTILPHLTIQTGA